MDHIGIDVHKKDSQICILTGDGELIEHRVRTEAGRFAEVLSVGGPMHLSSSPPGPRVTPPRAAATVSRL